MADDGGAGRCLSDLSDDLLQHILSFAPASDRATTAVLSRRWLRLWRTSGDVYLDSRSFNGEGSAFLRGAERVLAAAEGHVRRLTLVVAAGNRKANPTRLDLGHYRWESRELIAALVSIPAARRVEELQIEVKTLNPGGYTLSFGHLPSEPLRVLRIIQCSNLTAGSAAAFPMLAELHLQNCSVSLVDLQRIVDAAPRLSTLHLASFHFSVVTGHHYDDDQLVKQLHVPTVTDLVLADCRYGYKLASIELDVPRLQCFRYTGHVQDTKHLLLKSTSNVIKVDLHLTNNRHEAIKAPDRASFWRLIQNFSAAKLLRLKLDFTMDHLAVEDQASRDDHLGGFSLHFLDQLEVEAQYMPQCEKSMMMLANLLHSCPMVRDLALKLRKWIQSPWVDTSIDNEAGVHFDRSVNGFRNRRRRPMVSLGREDDDNYYQAFGIVPSCLTGEHSFSCLQSRLKRVSLQFFMDEPNCLGVQLTKFFVENAMVLQEIHIDDGCHEMQEHVNPTVRRWIAKTDKVSKQVNVKD